MVMVSKFSNLPDRFSENDEIREYELSKPDCMHTKYEVSTSNPLPGGGVHR